MRTLFLLPLLLFSMLACSPADGHRVTVRTGEAELRHAPLSASFAAGTFSANATLCVEQDGTVQPAQLEITPSGEQLVWWLQSQPASSAADVYIRDMQCPPADVFAWEMVGEQSERLHRNGLPVMQYEFPVHSMDDIEGTRKPYHHVFDPAGGGKITKGVGGLFSHHRGIYFGYNVITLEGYDRNIDVWHASNGDRTEHEEVLERFEGPVMGGHTVRILWKDHQGDAFADEVRTLRAFRKPRGETLIDFHSELQTLGGSVRLDGDRQHAGVQFRAAQFVADHTEYSYYIRPDAWNHLAPTDEVGNDNNHDFGWNAFHFQVEGRPFTTLYLSHPANPKPAEMSERQYGRFGEFFRHELTPDNPLISQYRFWITAGSAPERELFKTQHAAYSHSVDVVVR